MSVISITRRGFVTVGTDSGNDVVTGTVDGLSAVQTAIDQAVLDGKEVIVTGSTPVPLSGTILLPNNVKISAEIPRVSGFSTNNGVNASVFGVQDASGYLDNATLIDLRIDPNRAGQSTGGGGFSGGLRNSTFTNLLVEESRNFNILVLSQAGSTVAGTITLTRGESTATGVGSVFTAEVEGGDYFRTSDGKLCRIESVISDTELLLTIPWNRASFSGTVVRVLANSNNVFDNLELRGSLTSDNFGIGLGDNCTVSSLLTMNSGGGGGFVPDHCYGMDINGVTAINNNADGVSLETVMFSTFSGINSRENGNGLALKSTAWGNNFYGVTTTNNNAAGITIQDNQTDFDMSSHNTIHRPQVRRNGIHGIRWSGHKNVIINARVEDNSNRGIILIGGSNGDATENEAINPFVKGSTGNGIELQPTTSGTKITDGQSLTSENGGAGLVDNGINNIFRRVGGYPTEIQSTNTTLQTANFTATAGVRSLVNTATAITVTPPASPYTGMEFEVSDATGNAHNFPYTVDFTGTLFHGSADTYVADQQNETARFKYIDATTGWLKVGGL